MSPRLQLIEVTNADGVIVAADWLARAERTHRELRPQLPPDYASKMQRVFAQGGRMVVAAEGDVVLGVAVWRAYENSYSGVQVYVDDLVTSNAQRSTGVGRALIDWLTARSQQLGAAKLTLDSGTQRVDAHRFYLRERFHITAFHFEKKLDPKA